MEEVALLLALDRDVVDVRVVDIELAGEVGVALRRHLDEVVPGGLIERRHDTQAARLGLELDRKRPEIAGRLGAGGE